MSKRANPAMTGAFVLGAVGLVIAGILIFGSGELLKTKYTYVMYFQGSVSGLAVGAPVEFRGVKVGDPKDLEIRIPVVVEFVQGSLHRLGAEAQDSSANIARLVELGMRAQLQVQSLLTGQQMIALDIHEDDE
ncbi:MAG: MCE family protein, partial [Deltaproteobacteria bacterium]|nr:MCE family protein [Deltaproteobacteria bacterium]